jgi:hypothetical protein
MSLHTLDPAALLDLQTAVAASDVLPAERKRALVSLLLQLRAPPLQFRYCGAGTWLTNGGRWAFDGRGAALLHLAMHNPGRWLDLAPGASLRAQQGAAARAARHLAGVDGSLARVLAPARAAEGVGLRFRLRAGLVQMRWRPPPGRTVATGVPLA